MRKKCTLISFLQCAKAFTHFHSLRFTKTTSDISSLIQPLIGFGHRAEGVMKDSGNKKQTGGRDKERWVWGWGWGGEIRRGSGAESPFATDL